VAKNPAFFEARHPKATNFGLRTRIRLNSRKTIDISRDKNPEPRLSDTRLIEEAFPLKQVSLDSVHEKSVRHGHISTLHVWPARRPLAACRAAILATLLPDPGDCSGRQKLCELIGGTVEKKLSQKTNLKSYSTSGGVLRWLGAPPKSGNKAIKDYNRNLLVRSH
jgi:hypothetical protein